MGKKIRITLDVTELGRAGGRARAANMSGAERSAAASVAALARWAKFKTVDGQKNKGAVRMAKQRAESLSPERRSEIAGAAGAARWAKVRAANKGKGK
jgi:hypothetical protein